MDLLTMLPLLSTLLLSTMLPQLSTLLLLTMPLPTLMSHPPTLTPTLLLMTTPTPTSTLLRLVMVPETLKDLTPLLFLMAVPSMLPTRLMAMLAMSLMLPMTELLSTQMPLHLTRLPLSLPMLVKNDRGKRHQKTKLTDRLTTVSTIQDTQMAEFIYF